MATASQNRNSQDDTGVSRMERATEFCIEDHPTSAALTTFVCGIGAGLALTALLAGGRRRRQPDSFAERVGHQVLGSMTHSLPVSLAKRLHR